MILCVWHQTYFTSYFGIEIKLFITGIPIAICQGSAVVWGAVVMIPGYPTQSPVSNWLPPGVFLLTSPQEPGTRLWPGHYHCHVLLLTVLIIVDLLLSLTNNTNSQESKIFYFNNRKSENMLITQAVQLFVNVML